MARNLPNLPRQKSTRELHKIGKIGDVKFCLRDFNEEMVKEWKKVFTGEGFSNIQISQGDILEGAPAVDALVAPSNNSFGFLESVVETKIKNYFGEQVQQRLQHMIRTTFYGEVLVGQAAVIPTFVSNVPPPKENCTGGQHVKFLISAPVMRIHHNVSETVNPYLAFRAVILAIMAHNEVHPEAPIKSVLCPGLGTGTSSNPPIPKGRSASQMHKAYEVFVQGKHPDVMEPPDMGVPYEDHEEMASYWR